MPGKPPDFSTSFWKEFKLRYPWPEICIGALGSYVVILIASIAPDELSPGMPLVLGVAVGLALAMSAACSGSWIFSSRRWLAQFKRSSAGGRVSFSEVTGQWLRAMVPSLLAAAILLPLFGWCGWASARYFGNSGSRAVIGLVLLEMALGSILATGGVAARALIGRGRGETVLIGFCSLVVVLALRGLGLALILVGLHLFGSYPEEAMPRLAIYAAIADAAMCLVIAVGSLRRMRKAIEKALTRGFPGISSDRELILEHPEYFGLEVSFWSLLRWKFWADPMVRVERRSAWSWKSLICVWLLLLLLAWPSLISYVIVQLYHMNMFRSTRIAQFLISLEWGRVSWLIAPAIMVVGFCNQRRNGVLDAFLLTPVAPLRLMASKLFGRLWHLIIPATSSLAAIAFWSILCETNEHMETHPMLWGMLGVVWVIYVGGMGIMATGALGLYFAVRCRTMMGALAWSYTSVVLWMCLERLLIGWLVSGSTTALLVPFRILLVTLTTAVVLALFLRWAFPAIARRLVLQAER